MYEALFLRIGKPAPVTEAGKVFPKNDFRRASGGRSRPELLQGSDSFNFSFQAVFQGRSMSGLLRIRMTLPSRKILAENDHALRGLPAFLALIKDMIFNATDLDRLAIDGFLTPSQTRMEVVIKGRIS